MTGSEVTEANCIVSEDISSQHLVFNNCCCLTVEETWLSKSDSMSYFWREHQINVACL